MATSARAVEATENYLKALTLQEQAEQMLAEVKETMLAVYQAEGISETEVNDLVVKVSASSRRTFDIEKLREKLSPALFRKVTKPTVDTRAWDSAQDKGEITKKVISTCVEVTSFFRVTVKPAKGAQKPATKQVSEVA
jgi:hypothetical protein